MKGDRIEAYECRYAGETCTRANGRKAGGRKLKLGEARARGGQFMEATEERKRRYAGREEAMSAAIMTQPCRPLMNWEVQESNGHDGAEAFGEKYDRRAESWVIHRTVRKRQRWRLRESFQPLCSLIFPCRLGCLLHCASPTTMSNQVQRTILRSVSFMKNLM